jgi:hypothetical protein
MKKTMILTVIVLVAAVGTYVVMAQQNDGGGMMRGGMRGGMQGRGMMMGGDGMGMGMMMSNSALVATQDGGVIVLIGNELLKYDKDLNMVKKTEVQFDWENWQKMMMEHRNMMMGQSENR